MKPEDIQVGDLIVDFTNKNLGLILAAPHVGVVMRRNPPTEKFLRKREQDDYWIYEIHFFNKRKRTVRTYAFDLIKKQIKSNDFQHYPKKTR